MAVDNAYTTLLLHLDGSDNGTTFTDESGKTVTRGGNVVTKTAQKKFGTASAFFDGNGDYLSIPGISIGKGQFTIELQYYRTAASGLTISYGGSNTGFVVVCNTSETLLYANGNKIVGSGTSINTWHHCALVGNGGAPGSRTMKLYIDGTLIGTWTNDYNYVKTLYIGANEAATSESFNGYIDEVRVSNTQRWTSDFTPPTEAYEPPIIPTLYAEYLIVGGGGGGASGVGGGGGGGGVLSGVIDLSTFTPLTVVVGTGGTAGTGNATGGVGGDSSFGTLVAGGGGSGGSQDGTASQPTTHKGSGGGGGGGTNQPNQQVAGEAGNYGAGYVGAIGVQNTRGGGGGGASAGGSIQNGGQGFASSISGSSYVYGSGGGGGVYTGTGGVGGTNAGNGGYRNTTNATSGVDGSGGGGGGSGGTLASQFLYGVSGRGGNGTVIVKYRTVDFGDCTGGTITVDGEYTIHTFTTNGTFTPMPAADYLPSGHATFGPFILPILIADPASSAINWTENKPTGTELIIKAAIVDTSPEETDFQVVTNGGEIPGLVADSSGKNLYIKAYLSTTDVTKTPALLSLDYEIIEQSSPYTIKINLTYAGRMKHPQGDVGVLYTNGLSGPGPTPVAGFLEEFTPTDLTLWFKPNDPEYITIAPIATITVFDVTYKSGKNGDEYLKAGAYNATITITNVGGLPL